MKNRGFRLFRRGLPEATRTFDSLWKSFDVARFYSADAVHLRSMQKLSKNRDFPRFVRAGALLGRGARSSFF